MQRPELHHQILASLNSDRTVHICQATGRDPFNFIDFLWKFHIPGSRILNQAGAQNLLHARKDFTIARTDHNTTFSSATAHEARRILQETALGLGTGAQYFCMGAYLNSILGVHRIPGPLRGTTCHQEPDRGVSG